EAHVAPRASIVDVGPGRVLPLRGLAFSWLSAVEVASRLQAVIQQAKPVIRPTSCRAVDESGDCLRAELKHILHFQQSETAESDRGSISERICLGYVPLQCCLQRRKRLFIDAQEQLLGRRRPEDLIEKDLEARIRDLL